MRLSSGVYYVGFYKYGIFYYLVAGPFVDIDAAEKWVSDNPTYNDKYKHKILKTTVDLNEVTK